MLLIAATNFNSPSETFIREHVHTLAPGETVLLCDDETGTGQFDCPVLSLVGSWRPPRSLRERVANAIRVRWNTYVDAGLSRAERAKVLAFIDAYQPQVVLAEYGNNGYRMASVCREAK